MSWFRLDDDGSCHPKVMRAGNDAYGSWCRAGQWASKHATDGFIPDEVAPTFGSEEAWKRLENCGMAHGPGLVERVDGGWQIHDFLEYNPSAAERFGNRNGKSEKRRSAGKLGAAKRWSRENGSVEPSANECHNADGNTNGKTVGKQHGKGHGKTSNPDGEDGKDGNLNGKADSNNDGTTAEPTDLQSATQAMVRNDDSPKSGESSHEATTLNGKNGKADSTDRGKKMAPIPIPINTPSECLKSISCSEPSATPSEPDDGEAAAVGVREGSTNAKAPKAKRSEVAKADLLPSVLSDREHRVYEAILADSSLQPIVKRPAMLAQDLCKAGPGVDVAYEVACAGGWLRANPTKAKHNGDRFLHSWICRSQDRNGGQNANAAQATPARPRGAYEVQRSPGGMGHLTAAIEKDQRVRQERMAEEAARAAARGETPLDANWGI